MKKILMAIALCLVMAGAAYADGVDASFHDLNANYTANATSAQACVYCHHPHRGVVGGVNVGNEYLWNITGWDVTYFAPYDSNTMNATASGVLGSASPVTGGDVVSRMCMVCHDGTIGAGALLRVPSDTNQNIQGTITLSGGADLGDTLVDDHPVNFTYNDAETDPGIKADTTAGGTTYVLGDVSSTIYPLFGGGTMQCGTCHDPHRGGLGTACAGTNGFSCDDKIEFMVGDTTDSAICRDCHTNK